jgi:hypothetical protein
MQDQRKRIDSWTTGSDEAVRETEAAILASGNRKAIAEWQGLSCEGRRAMVRRVGHRVGGRGYGSAIGLWAGALVVILLDLALVPQEAPLFGVIFVAGVTLAMYGVFVWWRQIWRDHRGR